MNALTSTRWLPWKFVLKRLARRRGFIDPLQFVARLRQFSQPSQVQEPIELIRAGVAFHARGLINTKIIQNNLDWIWPYWIQRQFNPHDKSFLPRAFSFSHVNLTHRNWTAVGLPGLPCYSIVDPRGLVTPLHDGWSLDLWFLDASNNHEDALFPSACATACQLQDSENGLTVTTKVENPLAAITTKVFMETEEHSPRLCMQFEVVSQQAGRLALAVRPFNPEGVQFIDQIDYSPAQHRLLVDKRDTIIFSRPPDHVSMSNYADGDVIDAIKDDNYSNAVECQSGLATAAALFRVQPGKTFAGSVWVPLDKAQAAEEKLEGQPIAWQSWQACQRTTARMQVPDARIMEMYRNALHTVILLAPHDIYPGPYTYKRFWFRDSCLIMQALLKANLPDTVHRALLRFPARQKRDGYFHSQEGEWDSNGQVLWIAHQYARATNTQFDAAMLGSLRAGAQWILHKREETRKGAKRHAGLLPAGFSAEHFGPNDFYYWDDFWGIAGLQAAADLFQSHGHEADAEAFRTAADAFSNDIEKTVNLLNENRVRGGLPASPYRRLDAGAIGSMVADYPLQLNFVGVDRIDVTLEYILQNCMYKDAFFQDMIHSGMNAYLTLALAQSLLRRGDPRFIDLIRATAHLASPTGHWPEAIHPHGEGGCMGDGQHAWAAAEWIAMMRNLFLREEQDTLVVGQGLFPEWLQQREVLSFGPTLTPWGTVSVSFHPEPNENWSVQVEAQWHRDAPPMQAKLPGCEETTLRDSSEKQRLQKCQQA